MHQPKILGPNNCHTCGVDGNPPARLVWHGREPARTTTSACTKEWPARPLRANPARTAPSGQADPLPARPSSSRPPIHPLSRLPPSSPTSRTPTSVAGHLWLPWQPGRICRALPPQTTPLISPHPIPPPNPHSNNALQRRPAKSR